MLFAPVWCNDQRNDHDILICKIRSPESGSKKAAAPAVSLPEIEGDCKMAMQMQEVTACETADGNARGIRVRAM